MLVNYSRQHVLGPLVLLGTLVGLSPVNAAPSAYDEAVARASRLLPRQPEKIEVVERDEGSHVRNGTRHVEHVEAFVNHGGRVVYLIRQGVTLQATLKGPGIFDYVLATVIWHEMAHIDGADEVTAQEAEEQLWREFIVSQRVDRTRGMKYLDLLRERRDPASVVKQKRPPPVAERRGFPIPLLEKRRQRSAVDGQPALVRPRQPVDRLPPRELLPVPTRER